jgi:hypothetical protein
MVISQKIDENKMDYRGSKSVLFLFCLILINFYLLKIFLIHLELQSIDQITILMSVSPIIIYKNADQDKIQIFKDNLSKSGIYR